MYVLVPMIVSPYGKKPLPKFWLWIVGKTVGTLPEGYVRNVPLPRVPVRQSAIPDYYKDQYGVPTYITPRSLVESAAYAFSPAWQAIAINT